VLVAKLDVLLCILDEELKGMEEGDDSQQQQQMTMIVKTHDHDERIDGFWEHYRPYELTVLGDQYCFNMPNSIRCHSRTCFSVIQLL